MTGLYKRRRVWWIRFRPTPGAEQCRISTGETDEAKAIVAARAIVTRESVEARKIIQKTETEIEAYLATKRAAGLSRETISSRSYVLKAFAAEIGAETPRAISREAVAKWFDRRSRKHLQTAVAYLQIVRYWLAFLVERGRLAFNVADLVEPPDKIPPRHRQSFLLPDQAKKLLEAAKDDGLRFAIFCGLHSGLRKQEVIEARRSWFDLDAGLLHVQTTPSFIPKDRDARTIPLTAEFCAWLKDYVARLPEGAVFMLAPKAKKGKARYRYDFRKAFDTLAKDAELEWLTFHDLRRTFASLLVSRGVSIYKVAKWLGDAVDVVETTYGHLIAQDEDINKSWD